MSSINKALEKAQRERDSRQQEYKGVTTTQSQKSIFPGKPVLIGSLVSILVLFALAFYIWSTPGETKNTERQPVKHKEQSPASIRKVYKATVKNKKPLKTMDQAPLIPDWDTASKEEDAERLFEKGRIFQKDGLLNDAKRVYEMVLKADPVYVDALNNLGVIYLHEKNYSAAQASFEKAFRLAPRNVDPCYNLACVFALNGEIEQGILYLKKAFLLNASAKIWARADNDLKSLRGMPEFENIMRDG
jgi:tetratricopeptide (TPR) repeat protein